MTPKAGGLFVELVEIGFVLGEFFGAGVLNAQLCGPLADGGLVDGVLCWAVFGFIELVDETELGTGHAEIDFGQEFAVDECAVEDAAAAVNVEAGTQGIE